VNRRSFAQSVGGAIALSALANSSAGDSSCDKIPGKVLAIAAHPGDGLFTMGAALAQQIERGGSGALLSLSLGERGAPKDVEMKQYGDVQRTATERATHLIGAEAMFVIYPDAEIPLNEESTLAVCDGIREYKPDIVITHWSGSWHKDHQNCHLIVRDAIFYAGLGTLIRSRPAHSVSKLFYADNWRMPQTLCPTCTWTSKRFTRSGSRRAISIPCGEGKPDFFGITITTALFRLCVDVFRVSNMRWH